MKKVLLLAMGLCLSMAGFAQEEISENSVTGKKQDGLQFGLWVGPNYSCNENLDRDVKHNTFYVNSHSISAGGMLMLSKEFSNIFGWRASAGFYNNRGRANYWSNPNYWYYSFQDAEVFGDLTMDLTDLIAPNRNNCFNLKLFAGVGGAYVFSYPKESDFKTEGEYMLNCDQKLHYGGRVGLSASWRLSDSWRLGVQASCSMFDDKFSGCEDDKKLDLRNDLLIGFVYTFPGKKKVAPAPEPIPEPVVVPEPEPEPVVVPEPEPEPVVVPEPIVTPKVLEELTIPLYFSIRESNILPENDVKIQKLVDFVNNHKATTKITCKGYADKGTGNPRINVGYSKLRATKTAAELVKKYNISEDQIETTWYGDTVQPYEENDLNRCAILSVKEIDAE